MPVTRGRGWFLLCALMMAMACAGASRAQNSTRPTSRISPATFDHVPESWQLFSKVGKYRVEYTRHSARAELLARVDPEWGSNMRRLARPLDPSESTPTVKAIDLKAIWSGMLVHRGDIAVDTLTVQAELFSSPTIARQRTTREGVVERDIVRTATIEVSRDPKNNQVTVSRRTFMVFDLIAIAGPLPLRRLPFLEAQEWKPFATVDDERIAMVATPKDLNRIQELLLIMDAGLGRLPQVYGTIVNAEDYAIAQYAYGVADGPRPTVILTDVYRLTQRQGKCSFEHLECSHHSFDIVPDDFRLDVRPDDVFVDDRVHPPRSRKTIKGCPTDALELLRVASTGR